MKKLIYCLSIVVFLFGVSNLSASTAGLEKALKDIKDGTRPAADLTITYEAGNPNWKGLTVLTVTGDGKANIVQTIGNKKDTYSGTIDDKGMKALIGTMVDDKYWNVTTKSGPWPPDTTLISIKVKTKQGDANHTLTCTSFEALTDKASQTTYRVLQSLLGTISSGKVKY